MFTNDVSAVIVVCMVHLAYLCVLQEARADKGSDSGTAGWSRGDIIQLVTLLVGIPAVVGATIKCVMAIFGCRNVPNGLWSLDIEIGDLSRASGRPCANGITALRPLRETARVNNQVVAINSSTTRRQDTQPRAYSGLDPLNLPVAAMPYCSGGSDMPGGGQTALLNNAMNSVGSVLLYRAPLPKALPKAHTRPPAPEILLLRFGERSWGFSERGRNRFDESEIESLLR